MTTFPLSAPLSHATSRTLGPGLRGDVLGLPALSKGVPLWYPAGVTFGVDFTTNQQLYDGTEGAIVSSGTPLAYTRSGNKNVLTTAGTYTAFGTNALPATDLGVSIEQTRTNYVPRCRDLSNASWTKTNITAALDQTGIDGVSNSASSILATATNGTVSIAITDTSRARWLSVFVKRLVGAGTLSISMDNGTTYTDLTPSSSSWVRFDASASQTLANPTIVLKIGTSGDKFAIDCVQCENSSTGASSPIFTAGALVVRNSDVLTVASGIASVTAGTMFLEWQDQTGPIGTSRFIAGFRADSNNYVQIETTTANVINVAVRSNASGAATTVASFTSAQTVVKDAIYRVAVAWSANDFAASFKASLDGNPMQRDTGGDVPTGTPTFGLGQNGAGSSFGFIRLRRLFLAPSRLSDGRMISWTQSASDTEITFGEGDTISPPAGFVTDAAWPSTRNGRTLPNVFRYTGGVWTLSDVSARQVVDPAIWTVAPYYVDVSRADNSGDGLTAATAKRDINAAITTANADGQTAIRLIVAPGTYYQANSINGGSAVEPTKPIGIVGNGGTVEHLACTNWSFPGSADGTYTNSYVGGPTTAARVFDKLTLDNEGRWTEIPALATQTAVNASATGGYVVTGGAVTIRRADGARPTQANTAIFEEVNTAWFATTTKDIYIENVWFQGGLRGCVTVDQTTGASRNVAFKNVRVTGSGKATSNEWDGFVIQGMDGLVLFDTCTAELAMKDGFNFQGGGTAAGGGTAYMHVVGVNCYGGSNGAVPTGSGNFTTCNNWTGHTTVKGILVGANFGQSAGRAVHWINNTISWNYAVRQVQKVYGGATQTNTVAFAITAGSGDAPIMYVEKCEAWAPTFALQSTATGAGVNARMYTLGNVTKAGANNAVSTSGGSGTITAFTRP